MNCAAARAAMRRGSSITIFPPASHGASSSASGTWVVLPAPGGASSTSRGVAASDARMSGSSGVIGNVGAAGFMRGDDSGWRRRSPAIDDSEEQDRRNRLKAQAAQIMTTGLIGNSLRYFQATSPAALGLDRIGGMSN